MTTKEILALRARDYIERGARILDTETLGLTMGQYAIPEAQAVEVAIIDANGFIEFQSLVKPSHPIPVGASNVHHITDEMVANAPTYREIQPIITAIIGNHPVLAYNSEFDSEILRRSARFNGGIEIEYTWGCLMEAYKSFIGVSRWQKLEVACQQIGYQFEGVAHRAMADAKAARAVLRYMAAYQDAVQEALIEMPAAAVLTDYEKGIV